MWLKLIEKSKLETGKVIRVNVGNKPIGVYLNQIGKIYAFSDVCSHEDSALSGGTVIDDQVIECPTHGARFNMATGKVLAAPAVENIKSYETKLEGGEIMIEFTTDPAFIAGVDDIGYDMEDVMDPGTACACGGKCEHH